MRDTMHLDILVPLQDNDGQPFTPDAFERFEQFVLRVAGGLSRRGDVEGIWRSPEGVTMRDQSRSYVVTVPVERAAHIQTLLDLFIRQKFRQEAAYVEAFTSRATTF